MSIKGENYNNYMVNLSSKHLLNCKQQICLRGNILWLRAKTTASLKAGLKLKVVWNTCDKELGGEMDCQKKLHQ